MLLVQQPLHPIEAVHRFSHLLHVHPSPIGRGSIQNPPQPTQVVVERHDGFRTGGFPLHAAWAFLPYVVYLIYANVWGYLLLRANPGA